MITFAALNLSYEKDVMSNEVKYLHIKKAINTVIILNNDEAKAIYLHHFVVTLLHIFFYCNLRLRSRQKTCLVALRTIYG